MNSILYALSNNGFAPADYLVFGLYIVILVGLGLFLSRGKKGQEKSSSDYFLAGNTLTWWAVGASLIAANISAEQFIGMSGSAYRSGIAMAAYELMAALTLIIVAKFLLPIVFTSLVAALVENLSVVMTKAVLGYEAAAQMGVAARNLIFIRQKKHL